MSFIWDNLGILARAKPFVPFRLHLVDGRLLDVNEAAQLFPNADLEDESFTIHSPSDDGKFDEVELLTTRSIVSITVRVRLK